MYKPNPKNLALLESLQESFNDLLEPLEFAVKTMKVHPFEEAPSALWLLSYELQMVICGLLIAANQISDEEIELYSDFCWFFSIQSGDLWNQSYSLDLKRSGLRDALRKNRDDILENNGLLPPSIKALEMYDAQHGSSHAEVAKVIFFRFANSFVKIDGSISTKEEIELKKIKNALYEADIDSGKPVENQKPYSGKKGKENDQKVLDELINELGLLVGLERVKNDVTQLVNFLKVQKLRESKGLPVAPVSRHLVFYGNPGTGKTTVARLLSNIYKHLGILSKGHLIETDRAGLVAGYVGQTALKVKEVAEKALGGILFIDEAYSLSVGGGEDFGQEAIDALLKFMEDNRDDLIVVVAGYTDLMDTFLSSNPGLRSRFNKYLIFDDYNPQQLVEIFNLFCTRTGFQLSEQANQKAEELFCSLFEKRDKTFGNGRLARNIFEVTISNQANRIITLADIDEETLSLIEGTDIPTITESTTS
jgi:SpoVK/Ycf46/Vps4 family AAA+-type ATPase